MGEKTLYSEYGPKKTTFDKFYKRGLCKLNEWCKMKHDTRDEKNACLKLEQ